MKKEFKVLIADTNWWISLVIKNFDNAFASLILSPNLLFIGSDELTTEIKKTFKKERLQKYFLPEKISHFWFQYEALVTIIDITSTVKVCRDPADNFLLALAKDGKADFLITGDKDLLVLEKFESTIICTLSDFINKYLQQ